MRIAAFPFPVSAAATAALVPWAWGVLGLLVGAAIAVVVISRHLRK